VHTSRLSQSLSYSDLLAHFKITSLAKRRNQYDIVFAHKIMGGEVNSAFLLGSFPILVPARITRAMTGTLLHVPYARVETIKRGWFLSRCRAFQLILKCVPRVGPLWLHFRIFPLTVRQIHQAVATVKPVMPGMYGWVVW